MKKNFVILLLIIGNLVRFIWSNSQAYISRYDIDKWQKAFSQSQLALGGKAIVFFSDSQIYAIAGYKYLKGESPVNIHPEVPPLGKYIIGLGILIFGNENLMNLLLGTIILSVFFFISKEVLNDKTLSLLAVLLISLNSEYKLLLTSSNIDIPQLFFLSLSFLFIIKSVKNTKYLPPSFFFVGLIMSTKFYLNGLLVYFVFLGFIVVQDNFKLFIKSILSSVFVLAGFGLPYLRAFVDNPSILWFIRFQRWLTSWWAGNAQVEWGGIVRVILTGHWSTWWEQKDVIRVAEWDLTWPLITIVGLFSIFLFKKRNRGPVLLCWIWPTVYLMVISTTSAFPRYLVCVFPFFSILTVYFVSRLHKLTLSRIKLLQ